MVFFLLKLCFLKKIYIYICFFTVKSDLQRKDRVKALLSAGLTAQVAAMVGSEPVQISEPGEPSGFPS